MGTLKGTKSSPKLLTNPFIALSVKVNELAVISPRIVAPLQVNFPSGVIVTLGLFELVFLGSETEIPSLLITILLSGLYIPTSSLKIKFEHIVSAITP